MRPSTGGDEDRRQVSARREGVCLMHVVSHAPRSWGGSVPVGRKLPLTCVFVVEVAGFEPAASTLRTMWLGRSAYRPLTSADSRPGSSLAGFEDSTEWHQLVWSSTGCTKDEEFPYEESDILPWCSLKPVAAAEACRVP